MLERAAECLKPGGLQRLLRPTQRTRNRRMLHSAFWDHGAGQLDLPSWWNVIQNGARVDLANLARGSRQASLDPTEGAFLDFLYPSGAVALIRKYSRIGLRRLKHEKDGRDHVRVDTRSFATAAHATPTAATATEFDDSIGLDDRHRNVRRLLRGSASVGDAPKVEKLLEYMFEQYGPPKDCQDLSQLIHVYARRGELENAIDAFDQISAKYGLTPDIACWNSLINAYVRVEDLDGALKRFEESKQSGHKPTAHTFGTLMAGFAKRGDTSFIEELFRLADMEGIPPDIPMVNCLVSAHVATDELERAEDVARACVGKTAMRSGDAPELRTRMWNYILTGYSWRKDPISVQRVYHSMQEAGIPFDTMTYATLMQSLVFIGHTISAHRILKHVMVKSGIQPSAYHYGVLMGGYINTKYVHLVLDLYRDMVQKGIHITPQIRAYLIKARYRAKRRHRHSKGPKLLAEDDAFLEDMLHMTSKSGFMGRQSSYFDFLIFEYGHARRFDRVDALYKRYCAITSEHTQAVDLNFIKLLNALLIAHKRGNDDEAVEECWRRIYRIASERARPTTLDPSKPTDPPLVLPAQRFTLAIPLLHYMDHLSSRSRLHELTTLITSLRAQGFALTNRNWNVYIRLLARSESSTPETVLLAFQTCEEVLMPSWRGWRAIKSKSRRLKKIVGAPRPATGATDLFPTYRALAALARTLLELSRGPTLRRILNECQSTVRACKEMPVYDDVVQQGMFGDRVEGDGKIFT
ncbi:MAG: hypothetical protein M1824_005977 [Vezdaea acicularis]|nr:MAG: hypothetical protein M1824_005977 [Vezdaea acicularis]